MGFIDQKCTFDVLSEDLLSECDPFTCGEDDDMDEFFSKDALTYARRRIGKSYCFRLEEDEKQIVACFTLSNDSNSIRIWDLGSSKKNAMWKVLKFYEKNGFRYLFNRDIDEDLYIKPPKNEEERKERVQHPRTLATRLMYCDLLSD